MVNAGEIGPDIAFEGIKFGMAEVDLLIRID